MGSYDGCALLCFIALTFLQIFHIRIACVPIDFVLKTEANYSCRTDPST